jgi:hypothetical protein
VRAPEPATLAWSSQVSLEHQVTDLREVRLERGLVSRLLGQGFLFANAPVFAAPIAICLRCAERLPRCGQDSVFSTWRGARGSPHGWRQKRSVWTVASRLWT